MQDYCTLLHSPNIGLFVTHAHTDARSSSHSIQRLKLSRSQVLAERSMSRIWRALQTLEPWQLRAGCRQWHRHCNDTVCNACMLDE